MQMNTGAAITIAMPVLALPAVIIITRSPRDKYGSSAPSAPKNGKE